MSAFKQEYLESGTSQTNGNHQGWPRGRSEPWYGLSGGGCEDPGKDQKGKLEIPGAGSTIQITEYFTILPLPQGFSEMFIGGKGGGNVRMLVSK